MWAEENGQATLGSSANQELRSVGVTPGDINTDFDSLEADEDTDISADADIDLDLDVGGDALPADDAE